MAASDTEIANLALLHLGVGKEIASLETENSAEANAVRRIYDHARDRMFRDFSWPFTTKMEALTLVEEDPNGEWAYSYRYPSDCLMFRRILSGQRQDTRQSRIPYRITSDDDGRLILTDMEDAEAEWTYLVEDVTMYPPDFVMAFSWLIASYIQPRLTTVDSGLGRRAMEMYMLEVSKAQASSVNEEQAEEPPESEFIRERE